MNKNKNSKIMLVLSILLLFLIIGSVSATDETSNEKVSTTTNDGVDTLNTDSASVDEKASTADNLGSSDASNKDSTLESTNNELLSENPVNWTVLENEITGKESVKLNNNYYKYVSGDKNQINLTGIKVLDGNGATIDADNQVDIRPFQSSGNILIKNIHFINIKQTTKPDNNYRGGPILFDVGSSNIILDNCTFSQLTTTKDQIAGAIGISGGNNVTIKNCKFYDNKYYNSLVIFHPSHSENITIENCQFNNNTASTYNGDLYFAEVYNLTIKKCNFTNENAKVLIYGGNANSRNVTMSHCNIINTTTTGNTVTFNGQYTNVYDCNITNTTANSANYLLLVKSFSNVTYCNFDANTYINITNNRTNTTGAKYTRGLRLDGNNITIKYCNFSNCVANGNGGGILAGTITNTTIAFCNFKNNFATTSGGALNIGGTSNHNHVYNCTFVENGCRANGGAIEFYTSYSILENCTFNANFITNDHPNGHFASGGAIVLYNLADNVTIRNSIFINNHIEDPLNLQNDPMGYSGSAHNTNNSAGGAIGIAREANLYLNIVGCYFENNSAREGGAVSFNGQYASISDCEFVNNTARLYGGAIYTTALDSTIKDCNFTGNNAPNGKDSYASSKGSIHYEGLYFDEFYIKNDDNVHTSVGTGNGQSSDNPVEWSNDLYTYFKKGSQITLYIVGSLDNFAMRNLNNNYSNVIIKAQSTGSGFKDLDHTVFNIGAGHVTLDGLTFQNITDNVIVNNADGTNIKNCVFTGNNATGNGSCILGQSKGDNLIIDNCTFNGNNATNGGAIYIKNTTNTSQILNCKFFNNHAKEFGGAIYIDEGMYYYIFEPKYEGNIAGLKDNDASIDRALAMLPVIYASFTGNGNGSADNPMNIYLAFTAVAPNGKIIFAKSGDIINYNQAVVREFGKSNVTFIGNNTTFVDVQFYANSYARNTKLYNIIFVNYTQTAIKSESTDNLIQNCKFINCTNGCIIVTGDGSKAVNCTFENNTLDGNGTCILIDAKHITIEDSTFTGNNATGNGGAIYVTKDASDINLVNSEFNDNNATLGGAVYNNGALTIKESSSFTGNNATMGGAVYNNATLTIIKSDFTGNNATLGGAVYNNATLTINDSQFTTNNATYGGAVFSNAKVTIRGTGFTGNSAVYGGALFLNASDNTLDDLSFNDNSALFGSAIYINQTGTLTLKGTDFTSNRVSDEGEGTVYFAQNNTVTAKGLTFKNNIVGSSDLNIVAADGAILFSKVLYVSPEGNGHGIVSGERTTLSNALKQAVKDSIIYLEQGTYDIETLRFINQQVTIMGNGSTIKSNKNDKSLFIPRITPKLLSMKTVKKVLLIQIIFYHFPSCKNPPFYEFAQQ